MDFNLLIGYLIGIFCIVSIPAIIIYGFVSTKKKNKKILDAWDKGETYYEQPITEIDGEIVSKFTREGFVGGSKTAKFTVTYFILFKDRYGKAKEYEIRKDQYKDFHINKKGTLAIINGKVYDFK